MPGKDPLQAGMAVSGGHDDSRAVGLGRRLARSARLLLGGTALSGLSAMPALAQQGARTIGTGEVIQLAIFFGIIGAALISALFMIRERTRMATENAELRSRVAELGAAAQRAESLLNLRDQRVIVWGNDNRKPELIGSLPPECGAPEERSAFLGFGRWLSPRSAAALEKAIQSLREKGSPFDLMVETHGAAPLEAQGRKTANHAVVRFISISESHRAQARLKLENDRLLADQQALAALLDALDAPFWLRDADGKLRWANEAYRQAVEAESVSAVVSEGREFLGTQSREAIASHHRARPVFKQMLSTVIGGDRKMFSVTDVATPEGSAGTAADVSAVEAIREEYGRVVRSHADTLDQVSTAVAIFDSAQKLRFHNQAFQKLWQLDPAFLGSAPDNALVLDRLRSEGKIAEQPEWRRWKEGLLAAYRAVERQENLWHLPDGRTIRVLANPQPTGGVAWVFENLTERIDLESRYTTAVRVQGETLDNLAEGVVVFGPDGRVRLFNPAFASLWNLDEALLKQNVHISAIRAQCDPNSEPGLWAGLVAAVTGFDERHDRHGQTELKSGTILSYAVIHLPNGQVMMTFMDVTDSVNVERVLKEKNEALRKADSIKNEFVQHVSYELRSPLTNIIGFTELLALPGTGPLNQRQREYLGHIGSSSSVLLTIVNDILDLATVDAGIMQLEISEVQIGRTIAAAAELVAERMQEHAIRLDVEVTGAPQRFHADETRLRQILYNLLSNAVNYAPEASTITLRCRQVADGIEFAVHDDGPGMPPEVLDTVFKRFEPHINGGRRRGAGLGLSIVKSFVELHGGAVRIETGSSQGTTVICHFPYTPSGLRAAAE